MLLCYYPWDIIAIGLTKASHGQDNKEKCSSNQDRLRQPFIAGCIKELFILTAYFYSIQFRPVFSEFLNVSYPTLRGNSGCFFMGGGKERGNGIECKVNRGMYA